MTNTKQALTTLMGVLALSTFMALIGYAEVPLQITYQGQLTDQYGDPVPDGNYLLSFALYKVPTGGFALWEEAHTVTVTDGIYNVILGQGVSLNPDDFEGKLYLGVTVAGDSEMTPRQPVTAVGFALRAAVADSVEEGAVTEIMIQDSAVTTDKVADNAITESKIENGTVTDVKIQDGATLSEISDNDGAGSGLDADLFDGYDSSAFMPAGEDNWVDEAGDTMTGKLKISVSSGEGLSSSTASSANYTSAIKGYAPATSGSTYGVYGQSDSTSGYGIYGDASATSGTTVGVFGRSLSTSGRGVFGVAIATSGTNYGLQGRSDSTDGRGVYGMAPATSGFTYGVYGRSNSTQGHGVYGYASATSGYTYGVRGESESPDGYGVYGRARATSGTNYGLYGQSDSTDGCGVYGMASATSGANYGVYGRSYSTLGRGVWGHAYPTSGTTVAVYGWCNSSSGYDFYAGGAGTDYGAFTGAHEVKLSGEFPGEVTPGLIVAATGEAQRRENHDGSVNLSSTLPTVKLAERANEKAVLGVLVAEVSLPEEHWYEGKEGERFATVNALGEGRVWVSNSNGSLEAGDYITTSSIPGYGQRQDDDLIHSYTLGKAIETISWDTVTQTVEFNGTSYKVYLIAVIYTSG